MEKNKTYSNYTQEELSKMSAGTIADLIWDEWKLIGKPATLKDNLLEYEIKHRMDNW
jgi:hypothetical protein